MYFFVSLNKNKKLHPIKKAAKAKHVACRCKSWFCCHFGNLRCHKSWCSASVKNVIIGMCQCGESKIYQNTFNLFLISASDHDIIWFYIPMNYVFAFQLNQSLQNLVHDSFLSFNWETSFTIMFKRIWKVFHLHVNIFLCLKQSINSYNVFTVKGTDDIDFILKRYFVFVNS